MPFSQEADERHALRVGGSYVRRMVRPIIREILKMQNSILPYRLEDRRVLGERKPVPSQIHRHSFLKPPRPRSPQLSQGHVRHLVP